jgi:hypothetical protein
VLLGCELLQPTIKVFRDTKVHSHRLMVPKRYPSVSRPPPPTTPPEHILFA